MKQHSPQFLNLVEKAKRQVKQISAKSLKEKINLKEPFYLIDVREDNEWATGNIPTAIHLGKGIIERDIEKEIPDFNQLIVVYCSGGFRSILVANSLQQMGYTQVYSLEKGMQAWTENPAT